MSTAELIAQASAMSQSEWDARMQARGDAQALSAAQAVQDDRIRYGLGRIYGRNV